MLLFYLVGIPEISFSLDIQIWNIIELHMISNIG
ncbi:hypothetical protein P872_10095 [Rhodonellum psychrophilum GCM71 = DSM 17998]|uniref:Uncharacterized protein n=1 Tax=Rhodonellum psychrophilum GCM71 = DSM 17998 TaxID=1123057 RepID=U5BUS5_9BACT|nr:hypothetical protein P872_10095 [Rhodonellum psychrophilum GCM71 = DSM 17998]